MLSEAYIKASSVNRALEIIGDRWVIMILQQAFFGVRRFDEFQRRLGVARSTLTSRLRHLVGHGLMQRDAYSQRPPRYDYRLTPQGLDLFSTALLAQRWQQEWASAEDMTALALVHRRCGSVMYPLMVCSHCRHGIQVRDVRYREGPGASWVRRAGKRRRRSTVEGPPPARMPVSADLLELLGDRWTPQVAATVFFGMRRFEDMREALRVAPNILSDRLRRLLELDVLRTEPYQHKPLRLHYRLTAKGRDLYPVLLALLAWGDRWCASPEGPPLLLEHTLCGQALAPRVVCSECTAELHVRNVRPVLERRIQRVAQRQQMAK